MTAEEVFGKEKFKELQLTKIFLGNTSVQILHSWVSKINYFELLLEGICIFSVAIEDSLKSEMAQNFLEILFNIEEKII